MTQATVQAETLFGLRGTLRGVREELVRLRQLVNDIAKAEASDLVNKRAIADKVYRREFPGIRDQIQDIGKTVRSNKRISDEYQDATTRIENYWDDVVDAWPTTPRGAPATPFAAGAVLAELDSCILEIGYLTVPPRVNSNLAEMRPGQRMDYNSEFKDEIPDDQSRAAILDWMSRHSASVNGVVDVATGIIVSASPIPLRRAASWLAIDTDRHISYSRRTDH